MAIVSQERGPNEVCSFGIFGFRVFFLHFVSNGLHFVFNLDIKKNVPQKHARFYNLHHSTPHRSPFWSYFCSIVLTYFCMFYLQKNLESGTGGGELRHCVAEETFHFLETMQITATVESKTHQVGLYFGYRCTLHPSADLCNISATSVQLLRLSVTSPACRGNYHYHPFELWSLQPDCIMFFKLKPAKVQK